MCVSNFATAFGIGDGVADASNRLRHVLFVLISLNYRWLLFLILFQNWTPDSYVSLRQSFIDLSFSSAAEAIMLSVGWHALHSTTSLINIKNKEAISNIAILKFLVPIWTAFKSKRVRNVLNDSL